MALEGGAGARAVPQVAPTAMILRQTLRASREHGVVFLNNAKVGCTTVKMQLWCAAQGCRPADIRDVHALPGSPFENDVATLGWASEAFVFAFVRHPYPRVVSAYLSKVAVMQDNVWADAARLGGRDPGLPTDFDTFVEFISGIAADLQDPHWRPQHLNLLYPFVVPNLLADIGAIDALLPGVVARLFPGRAAEGRVRVAGYRTGARDRFRDYLRDPGTVGRLRRLYAEDFDAFGYDPDPSADPAGRFAPREGGHGHPGLVALAGVHSAAPEARRARIAALMAAPRAGHLADWALADRLRRAARRDPAQARRLLSRKAAAIAAGSALLRRVAAGVAAGLAAADGGARVTARCGSAPPHGP